MRHDTQPRLARGTVLSSRYQVLRRVGKGGMGEVYEVTDLRTRRRLACKTLHAADQDDPSGFARFENEARTISAIESEHLVQTQDFCLDPATGSHFFTMELLAGSDLQAVLQKEGPLQAQRVGTLIQQTALGLSKVHDAGIVHRDLKPENLFVVQRDDGSECIKILDFGIAKDVSGDPKTTVAIGTRLYMPPEQLRGEHPDARTDIFALGQVTFTLLTGHPYLEPRNVREPASRRALRYGVSLPPGFDAWFEEATADDPERRFDSALELAAGLCLALGLELPDVPPSPSAPRSSAQAIGNATTALLEDPPLQNADAAGALDHPTGLPVSGTSRVRAPGSRLLRHGAVLALSCLVGIVAWALTARWRARPDVAAAPVAVPTASAAAGLTPAAPAEPAPPSPVPPAAGLPAVEQRAPLELAPHAAGHAQLPGAALPRSRRSKSSAVAAPGSGAAPAAEAQTPAAEVALTPAAVASPNSTPGSTPPATEKPASPRDIFRTKYGQGEGGPR